MKTKMLLPLFAMLWFPLFAASAHSFTLVIDAGHGGHDAGALGVNSAEKNINLHVALAFGRYVERNCPDVKVIYTRKTDVFVPLMERANIANRAKADVFISVHTNALPDGKQARGLETYTLGMHRAKDNLDVAMRENSVISMERGYKKTYEGFDPKSSESYIMFQFIQGRNMEKSVELAKMIQQSVCATASRPDKGVHQAGFLVLRETSMPSCLIELGFITTASEEQLLNSDSSVDDIARGIYQAFLKYKNRYSTGTNVPFKSEGSDTPELPQLLPDATDAADSKASAETTDASSAAPTAEEKPAPSAQPAQGQPKAKRTATPSVDKSVRQERSRSDAPVFKVQILTSNRRLRNGDTHLQGLTDYDCYEEDGLVKYTAGASSNYNEIYRLRKQLLEKFPQAFIIAFKDGKKMDVNAAIREFVYNKKK